jgi:hypothetical protein
MKKIFFHVLSVFLALLLLGSCGTGPVVFNESLLENEVAVIHYYGVDIVEYNGISIVWKTPFLGALDITIPGGNTQFTLNGTTGSSNMGYTTYHNVPFVYNFENGQEYTVAMNQNLIIIYSGKSFSMKNHLVTFNMNNGQKAISINGKKV